MLAIAAATGSASAQVWRSDQGDGSFRNPVLYADYPDPDMIRVGTDYYLATTTFVNVPGITILRSKDLVNWALYAHVADRLDGDPRYDLVGGDGYRHGLYANSLRYHRGTFYIVVTPVGLNTRIYYAPDARGPWHYHELDRQAFDPGFFIDDDGKGYIATSVNSDGTITLLTLDPAFARVVDARKIHYIRGAEGSKLVKRGGWYYLFNAIPYRLGLTVSRARSLFGPWETRDQIDDRSGGHQGALVDLPNGEWFGFVMVDAGSIGRMTNLSPVFWQDDWPIWGTPDAPSRVPGHARKPIKGFPFAEPATSDHFGKSALGLQWQWNHNPDNGRWSLGERPGWLRLRAVQAGEFWSARNTLTQKGQGPWSRTVAKLDISHVAAGDRCGLGTLGQVSGRVAVSRDAGGTPFLTMEVTESTDSGPKTEVRVAGEPIAGDALWLGLDTDFPRSRARMSYSLDGRRWTPLGGDFPLAFAWRTGTFQGEQVALFCYNREASKGWLDIDAVTVAANAP